MKNTVTRTELEAIGQNWLTRRNKLLEYAQKVETPMDKSFKAWDLAHTLNRRIGKIIAMLGQSDAPKNFAPGGFVMPAGNTEQEFVLKTGTKNETPKS